MIPDIVFWLIDRDEVRAQCSLCPDLVEPVDFDDHARWHGCKTVAVASRVPEGQ